MHPRVPQPACNVGCLSWWPRAGTATDEGGPALSAAYHASLEDSAAAHFQGNSVINCMCGSTGEACFYCILLLLILSMIGSGALPGKPHG